MIFVTVGTQLPFDRLVAAVDRWAARHPGVEVFAQIGPSSTPPSHLEHAQFVSPARSDALMREAELIVGHAGMGTVLTALGYARPIVIVPRRAALGEHRNDHQLATARWLDGRPGIDVVWDEAALGARLDARTALPAGTPIPKYADDTFVGRLRHEVLAGLQGR